MASFQAKIGWDRPRQSEEKKNIVPFHSYPKRNRKKIQKVKNTIMDSFETKIGRKRM